MISRGSYKIEPIEDMGGGSFGIVQKVKVFNQKNVLCGLFAMKTMKSSAREVENFRHRFMREGHLQARCNHQNVVQIYICDLSGNEPWFVMELGETDVEKLILSGQFDRAERLQCIHHLLLGMIFIHHQGLLHRDIKPSNMIRVNGIYKVADFGLVKDTALGANSPQLTAIGQGMGTPGFVAPEAAFGHFSEQSDIYAIGTFLEYVCYNDPELSQQLHTIMTKCRERRPIDRYQTVNQILQEFQPIYFGVQNA